MSPNMLGKFFLIAVVFYVFSCQLLKHIPKFHINSASIRKSLKDITQSKSFHSTLKNLESKDACLRTPGRAKHIAKLRAILLGGSGVTLCLVGRTIWQQGYGRVQCEGNRLTGVIQKTLQQEDSHFDWKRFWSYLQPHLWELLGAIAVSLKSVHTEVC